MNIVLSDSDDDFIPTVAPPPRQPKPAPAKKKIKTKTKKEKKVLTSSQDNTAAPSKAQFMACLGLYRNLVVRTGRAARLTAEEARFQAELAEAMKLSEEEQCSSSAEIVPPATSTTSETLRVETEETKLTTELGNNKRKVEEGKKADDFKKVKTQSREKEEIVALVNTSEEEEEPPRRLLSSNKKKLMKKTIISSDEEEGGGDKDQMSKRKTAPRKKSKKKNVVLSEDENEEEEEFENVKEQPVSASTQKKTKPSRKPGAKPVSPVAPLKTRNTEADQQSESSGPVPATPQLSSSLATVLGKLSSSKSTPVSPGTPVQRKLPTWNPPAKVGTPGAPSGPVGSPAIGLRLGLSRSFKSKPLHASVKVKN